MLKRFDGEEGRGRLVELLCGQVSVAHNGSLAGRLAEACKLEAFAPGADLILQGSVDNDVLFILSGTCDVLVNNRLVAERGPGKHVGEMAAIDPSARRSATVRARNDVVAARVSDTNIAAIGRDYPELYRQFANELASRLRERTDHIKAPNGVPRIFIGSSVEGLPVIQVLQRALQYDRVSTILWSDNIVTPGQHVCDALLAEVRRSDFAVFHASADDKTWSRTQLFDAPRDNVIFELGLFLGVLGKERAFLLMPRGKPVKIPSDLLGITPLTYEPAADSSNLVSSLGPVALALREAAERLGTA